MNLQHRIDLLNRLGQYILSNDESWQSVKERAGRENGWFIPEFVETATVNIARIFLEKGALEKWATSYSLGGSDKPARSIGIVMAGNIPLVGFHDLLCVFISGHKAFVKPSSKDTVLIKHLVEKMAAWDAAIHERIVFADRLNGCDAFIATGSNNSSRYFDHYFGKYPNIIRRNRTSIAILEGNESTADLEGLADDVHLYFGLGCRNVTQIYVPDNYDFVPLLTAFRKYNWMADHHKYKNNYDYNLALHLLNKKYYMSNDSILLIEDPAIFSPISQLNYQFYSSGDGLSAQLPAAQDLQCIVGKGFIPFGATQTPSLSDYADGVDTLEFLCGL
jgi:hypothetical protein